MIERLIKNDLTLKRWRRFKKIKRAMFSLWAFGFIIFLSVTAEFWANNKPIIMKYEGSYYMPIYNYYHPSVFGQTENMVTDYKKFDFTGDNWALWPIIKWDPFESNKMVDDYPSSPSDSNWFGTDDRGRDVISRLIYGFRYSMSFAFSVWFVSYLIGIVAGAIMGYSGGKLDLIGQRVVEVFESMPILLLLITLVSIFTAGMWVLVIFTSFFGWMMISQYVRGEFLRLRKLEFVEAAEAMGASKARVIFKHILPNSLGPVVTFSPFTIANLISYLAILDYLGFGLQPPTPSWGELLQQAYKNFTIAWWLAVFPSLVLFFTLVILSLIGEGVRDAFDPKKVSK
ncbi:MAG: ABC transporter permease subunit [Bdellovibrionaceae bacterium]|nr:ABC transporter permease subunit [Pseudobdellovibrionaceae bacterium]